MFQYIFTKYTVFKNNSVFTRSIQYSITHSVFSKLVEVLHVDQIGAQLDKGSQVDIILYIWTCQRLSAKSVMKTPEETAAPWVWRELVSLVQVVSTQSLPEGDCSRRHIFVTSGYIRCPTRFNTGTYVVPALCELIA